jgi:hypothetical protein
MYCQFTITITSTSTSIVIIIIVINIIISIINIIIVIIIDVFGACCQGSWPMMPASGANQWWWPVLLASGVSSPGQWCLDSYISFATQWVNIL